MHEPLRSQLEEILQGRTAPGEDIAVQEHLAQCPACAAELRSMREFAVIVRTLRVQAAPEPAAGFYARVLQRVEAQGRPSFWNLLLDPVFGRRLVYATGAMVLLMTALLLATANVQPELAQTPVQLMERPVVAPLPVSAEFGEDVQRDREHFLVTMASFSE